MYLLESPNFLKEFQNRVKAGLPPVGRPGGIPLPTRVVNVPALGFFCFFRTMTTCLVLFTFVFCLSKKPSWEDFVCLLKPSLSSACQVDYTTSLDTQQRG